MHANKGKQANEREGGKKTTHTQNMNKWCEVET